MLQSTDVRDAVGGAVYKLQRTANFQTLQQCTTRLTTASDTSPFVVLLGWVNCSDKYLKKYSDLLSQLGYSSVRSIQPTIQAFSFYESPRRVWASNLLDYLVELHQSAPRPVVLWCFSNGGCWIFEQMLPLLQQKRYQSVRQALSGLIFDSCPCWMSVKTGTMALTEGQKNPLKLLLLIIASIYLPLYVALSFGGPKRFWKRMTDEALPIPRLYFYSSNDKLCPVPQLESLLAKKEQQKLDVTVKKFEKSVHCSHLRVHPDEYTAELKTFLAKVGKH